MQRLRRSFWVLHDLCSLEVLKDEACQTLLGPTEHVDGNIRRGMTELAEDMALAQIQRRNEFCENGIRRRQNLV